MRFVANTPRLTFLKMRCYNQHTVNDNGNDDGTIIVLKINMPTNKTLTIKEIAREAGVSTQTVSRVLNNRPDVSRETRRRIQQIIDQSGYHPSAVARNLIRQRSYTLGLIASHLNFYGPQAHLVQLDREATEVGYTLLPQLIHETGSIDLKLELRRLLSQQVDGIIWAIPQVDGTSSTFWEHVALPPIPMISVEDPIPNISMPAYVDEQTGARLATQHLLSQGFGASADYGRSRLEVSTNVAGWRETLEAAGLRVEERQIVPATGRQPVANGACICYWNNTLKLMLYLSAMIRWRWVPYRRCILWVGECQTK
jgi:DNA-binding LacI/PurR family transcriptional regulator